MCSITLFSLSLFQNWSGMKCQFKLLRMAVALICSKYHTKLGTRAASPILFVLVIILHADSEGFDFAAILVGTCSWTFWQPNHVALHCKFWLSTQAFVNKDLSLASICSLWCLWRSLNISLQSQTCSAFIMIILGFPRAHPVWDGSSIIPTLMNSLPAQSPEGHNKGN